MNIGGKVTGVNIKREKFEDFRISKVDYRPTSSDIL